ncbi:MAG: hypothetical protein K6F86_03640 [Lachnospiraceae bacterium]|nr:hypothetical protein [Lachnospiraceae bacterium]
MRKMNNIGKKIAVLGLAVTMLISQVPVAAFAAEPVSEAETEETEVTTGETKTEEPAKTEESYKIRSFDLYCRAVCFRCRRAVLYRE